MATYILEELQKAKVSFGEARVALTAALNSAIEAYLGDDGADQGDYTEEKVIDALWRAREAFESANGRWVIERDNRRIARLEADTARLRALLWEARGAISIPVSEANPNCNCRMCRVAKPLLACIDAELSPEGKGFHAAFGEWIEGKEVGK